MINELHIDGFRSLDDVRIEPLGRVNIAVGPGGSGKTNLLESAFLFCSNGAPTLLQTVLGLRHIGEVTSQDLRTHLEWFRTVGRDTPITIRGKWDDSTRSVVIKRIERGDVIPVADNATGLAVDQDARHLEESIVAYEVRTVAGDKEYTGHLYVKPSEGIITAPKVPNLKGRFVSAREIGQSHALAPAWTQAEDRGDAEAITALLRSLDPEIDGVGIRADEIGRASVRVRHRRLGTMPLECMGAGFGKAIAIACNIVSAENGVLVIDEFDASLHIGAQGRLIQYTMDSAKTHGVQLIVSTHSLETLDFFLEDYGDLLSQPEDLRVLQLKRTESGTEIRNFNAEEARHLRDEIGYDLRLPG